MKFKSIFILFSVTLLLFIAVLVLPPLFMLDLSFQSSFWRVSWPLALVLIVIFAGFNIFYFTNRRLFLLLEKEDWPALVRHLEDRVIQKGHYSSRLVRLLANCYLLLSDAAAVMSLENKVAIAKPALVNNCALVFGPARILGKDISGAARFFETRKDKVKPALKEWMRWYHGFALLFDSRFEEASAEFLPLARLSKDAIITGLSSYFLSDALSRSLPAKKTELREAAGMGKERVLKALPGLKNWNRERARLSTEIHAVVITKYMEETGRWLYDA